MPKTQSRYQQDLGFTDGILWVPANNIGPVPGGATITRNAAGDVSANVGASQGPLNLPMCLSDGQLFRTGFGEDLMEQFGGTGIPASAQPQIYRPDLIASMNTAQQLQPRTALKLKGIKFLSAKVVYQITTNPLTTHTCRIDQTIFANNVANAISAVLATGANGLATAAQANPYVTAVPLAANQQVYRVADLATLWFELTVTTPAGGSYRFYGAEFTCEFNFN